MVINRGRSIQFINGINGVNPGGNAVINMDVNKRYHRNILQVQSINYTGGTALATVALTGGGANNLTVTPTVVNGVITSVAVVSGGTGYTTGDTITITDATGTGFVGTVTAAAGVVTAVAVTSTGTPSATNPASVITALKQSVNGVVMRDITVDNLLRICQFNGVRTRRGELPLLYTEPWFNVNQLNEILSWDTFGQSTFSIQSSISAVRTSPGLVGIQEFDFDRNVRPDGNQLVPFLQPVSHHEYSFNGIAGLNMINTIPFDYPIRRIYIQGATPGNITQLEVMQDGNKVAEMTLAQMQQAYGEYGFQVGQRMFWQEQATDFDLIGSYNPQVFLQNPFDFAYLSDPDQRINKSLTCESSLVLRIQSAIAQVITVVVESLPGAYAA